MFLRAEVLRALNCRIRGGLGERDQRATAKVSYGVPSEAITEDLKTGQSECSVLQYGPR